MKLYATTISKTTSKGIGDDTMLTIELNHGNRRVGTLKYTIADEDGLPLLEIQYGETWHEIELDY